MDKFSELKAVAATYSVALNAHRGNPTDKGALYAWDGATKVFSRAISNREMEIIIALLAELEAKEAKIVELRNRGINAVTAEERTSTEWQKRAETAEQCIAELESDLGLKHVRAVEEALIFATDRNSELEAKLATPVIDSCDSDPMRQYFTCAREGDFYFTTLGSVPDRTYSLYRNEAEALFIGLRDALSVGGTVEGDE